MAVLIFPVFPELSARTEYGGGMVRNLSRQNGLKTGIGSSAPMTGWRSGCVPAEPYPLVGRWIVEEIRT
ncbi:MAG: hypothetical protein KBH82_12775 [Syntrophorhabdaceae bacterium]|jgi:hypothetical protein|nr:hypothetical protein [Syntrophorhabdaceae bacterium]